MWYLIYAENTLKFLKAQIFNIILLSGVVTLFVYEISFGTVLLYIFSLIGVSFTIGCIIVGATGYLSKETIDQNNELKSKVQKLTNLKEIMELRIYDLEQMVESLRKSNMTLVPNTSPLPFSEVSEPVPAEPVPVSEC